MLALVDSCFKEDKAGILTYVQRTSREGSLVLGDQCHHIVKITEYGPNTYARGV